VVGCGIHDVVVRLRRVEHVEAIVMLGGDGDEFHAGALGKSNDCVRVKVNRIKLGGRRSILVERDGTVRHDLLAVSVVDLFALVHPAKLGVETEVDEHTELTILPLLDGRGGWPRPGKWLRLIKRKRSRCRGASGRGLRMVDNGERHEA